MNCFWFWKEKCESVRHDFVGSEKRNVSQLGMNCFWFWKEKCESVRQEFLLVLKREMSVS
jgi:hypothetical protein